MPKRVLSDDDDHEEASSKGTSGEGTSGEGTKQHVTSITKVIQHDSDNSDEDETLLSMRILVTRKRKAKLPASTTSTKPRIEKSDVDAQLRQFMTAAQEEASALGQKVESTSEQIKTEDSRIHTMQKHIALNEKQSSFFSTTVDESLRTELLQLPPTPAAPVPKLSACSAMSTLYKEIALGYKKTEAELRLLIPPSSTSSAATSTSKTATVAHSFQYNNVPESASASSAPEWIDIKNPHVIAELEKLLSRQATKVEYTVGSNPYEATVKQFAPEIQLWQKNTLPQFRTTRLMRASQVQHVQSTSSKVEHEAKQDEQVAVHEQLLIRCSTTALLSTHPRCVCGNFGWRYLDRALLKSMAEEYDLSESTCDSTPQLDADFQALAKEFLRLSPFPDREIDMTETKATVKPLHLRNVLQRALSYQALGLKWVAAEAPEDLSGVVTDVTAIRKQLGAGQLEFDKPLIGLTNKTVLQATDARGVPIPRKYFKPDDQDSTYLIRIVACCCKDYDQMMSKSNTTGIAYNDFNEEHAYFSSLMQVSLDGLTNPLGLKWVAAEAPEDLSGVVTDVTAIRKQLGAGQLEFDKPPIGLTNKTVLQATNARGVPIPRKYFKPDANLPPSLVHPEGSMFLGLLLLPCLCKSGNLTRTYRPSQGAISLSYSHRSTCSRSSREWNKRQEDNNARLHDQFSFFPIGQMITK